MPYTQEWLAEQTGITRGTVNAYLNPKAGTTPKRRLGIGNAQLIAGALDVTVSELGGPDAEDMTLDDRLAELAAADEQILAGQRALLEYFQIPVPEIKAPGEQQRQV